MNCPYCGVLLPPGAGFCGACGRPLVVQQQAYPPPPPPPPPQAQAPIRAYPLIMQRGLKRLTGQMFVAPTRLYFICESQKGGMAVAIGRGLGGLIGGAIAAAGAPVPGQGAASIDEATLWQAVQDNPGSMVIEPAKLKAIKYTNWTRGIFYDGTTYALRELLDKELEYALAAWTVANNVVAKGLKSPKPAKAR